MTLLSLINHITKNVKVPFGEGNNTIFQLTYLYKFSEKYIKKIYSKIFIQHE